MNVSLLQLKDNHCRAAKDTKYQQLKSCLLYNILALSNRPASDFPTSSKFHMKKQI